MGFSRRAKGFPGGSIVKNVPASAGNAGLIPGWKDPLEESVAALSSILAWEIPRTEQCGGLQPMELQKGRIQLSN